MNILARLLIALDLLLKRAVRRERFL
jgi:hypothetical protein